MLCRNDGLFEISNTLPTSTNRVASVLSSSYIRLIESIAVSIVFAQYRLEVYQSTHLHLPLDQKQLLFQLFYVKIRRLIFAVGQHFCLVVLSSMPKKVSMIWVSMEFVHSFWIILADTLQRSVFFVPEFPLVLITVLLFISSSNDET